MYQSPLKCFRFLHLHPRGSERVHEWEEDFQDTIRIRETLKPQRLVDKTPMELAKGDKPVSESDQYAFISEISNNAYQRYLKIDGRGSTGHHTLYQLLLFQQVKDRPYRNNGDPMVPNFYPTSRRWRLLYDFVNPSPTRSMEYVKQMIYNWFKSPQASHDFKFEPRLNSKRKERSFQTRIVTVDPDIMEDLCGSGCLVLEENLATQQLEYTKFLENMLLYGDIRFRSIKDGECILIMNSYTEGYSMCHNSFEHITFRNDEDKCIVECTCGEYDYYLGCSAEVLREKVDKSNLALSSELTCFHCSIVFDVLLEVCKNPKLLDGPQDTDLMKCLAKSREHVDDPVVIISKLVPGQTMKMSVVGGDESPFAFVNLTADRTQVSCQEGYCQCVFHSKRWTKETAAKKKKKSRERLDEVSDDRICVHIQTLWLHYGDWEHLRSSASMDNENFNGDDIDMEAKTPEGEVNFDPNTQLWINKARSKHRPHEQDDENYKVYVPTIQ